MESRRLKNRPDDPQPRQIGAMGLWLVRAPARVRRNKLINRFKSFCKMIPINNICIIQAYLFIMKTLLLSSVVIVFAGLCNSFAQTPQAIPYQAVARNAAGLPLASQNIAVRFSIRDSIITGTMVYRETHTVVTNSLGLFNLNVGKGAPVSGASFANINWGKNAKFMQVEMDPAGGSAFVDLGTQQMMSVPYAIRAGSVDPVPGESTIKNLTSLLYLSSGF